MITYTFIKHLIKLIRWLYSIIKFIILSIIKIFIILTALITI